MTRGVLSTLLAVSLISPAFGGGTITWPTAPPAPDANPAVVPISPITGWLNQFQQRMDAARAMGSVDLLFDGDTYAITSYPKGKLGAGMWDPRLASLNAFEFSGHGDGTQTVLWRMQNGQLDGLHPKLVVLEVGSGNLQPNTPEQIAEGVKAIVDEYRKLCPDAVILLQGLFPRHQLATDPIRAKIKAVNQLIAANADGKKVIFLDFGDKFLQPDGTMTPEMFGNFNFPDPSPQAYKIWSAAIQPVIDQVFPPPATAAASPAASPSPASASTAVPAPAVEKTVTWPQAPVPPGANTAIIPVPPMGRLNVLQQTMDAAHKMAQVDIIFDGDSITAGWKGGGGAQWVKHYAKNGVDFGVSGDTTQGLLWRVQNGQVEGLHPKVIGLLIGTNNMGSCSAEQIAAGIKADVDEYRKRCPDAVIILQGILPRGEKPTDPVRAKVKAVNKIISGLADGKNVIFIDWGDKLLTPDGLYTKPVTNDFLHPNAPGYQIWVDAIQPTIDKILPPPAPAASASPGGH